jgi:undecaprenyl-diphosphatase
MNTNQPVMSSIFSIITHNLQSIVEHGGYIFIFISTISEGIPIFGQFIPGHSIVIVSGLLAKIDVLNIYKVFLTVILGAIIGDIFGFYLGRKYGISLLTKFGQFFFVKKEFIDKALVLVKENTAKTIILGRFSPITRTLSPFIVGASGIHTKKFWVFDSIGVLIWASVSIMIGYIFGASYHAVSAALGKYILIAILIGVFIIWGYRFINKQFHIFAKYELFTLGFNLFGLYLFFKTIQDAITDKVFLLELDIFVNDFFFTHSKEFIRDFMQIFTNIFSPTLITSISLVLIIYLIHKKNYYYSLISIFSLGGGYLFTLIVKNIVARIRPENAFLTVSGYSFPSGHAVASTVFFTLLIYFFIIKVRSMVFREILVVICVLSIILTSFSRVYLGVHWLSDVLAGIGLGLFWVTSMILLVKYINIIISLFKKAEDKENFK